VRARRWQALCRVPARLRLLGDAARLARQLRPLLWLRGRLPGMRRLSQRLLGIAADRSLPVAARQGFLARHRQPLLGPVDGRAVVLLVDPFTDCFEPELAEAALELLLAAG